ncbi:MAG: M24 family metallopeptidase [Rhodobacter sp.]|nr:M24 family metallopeptidase [Rhodobacter sp.]
MAHGIELKTIDLPDFGLPARRPELGADLYRNRLATLRTAARDAGLDAVAVYADREHSANLAYLTGIDPRFEEALLVLPSGKDPVLITGPENQGYAAISPLDLQLELYPPFGLLGQDRSGTPPLADLLHGAGLQDHMTIGIAGWKYFGARESGDPAHTLEVPSYIADTLRALAKDVVNAGALLMHPTSGLRAINEVDQIAQFEYAATHASEAVKRMLTNLRPGLTEYDLAAGMRLNGLPLSCHPMLSTGGRTRFGLASPSDKVIETGEPLMVAIGLIGGLTCRAGWVAETADDLPGGVQDYVERLAAPYFACAAEWYETIGIGVSGGEIDALVNRHLGDAFFNIALNPGHLIHLDEWMNTPIYPGSTERLASGMAVQLDIIPATGTAYGTVNIEDGIALLDAGGRAALADRHPAVWSRVVARRAFMTGTLGIRLKPETLPLSNLCGVLAPFLLRPGQVLVRA